MKIDLYVDNVLMAGEASVSLPPTIQRYHRLSLPLRAALMGD
ncbi:hypothetical protein N9I19_18855 [Peribacillus sp. CSMR9]|nr:hypothetical protein [Peribacillus sp. CSMR9]